MIEREDINVSIGTDQGETLFRVEVVGLYLPARAANRAVLRLQTIRGGVELLSKYEWPASPMRPSQATNLSNRVAEVVAQQIADKYGISLSLL